MKSLRRFKTASASLTFLFCITNIIPTLGEGGPLQDEISASQRGEYTQVINIGQQLIESYPNSDLAHYYLADAYYHTNQLRQAEEEYQKCLRVTRNKTLQTYCEDFLKRVQNISLQGITAPNSLGIKLDEVSKLHTQMHTEEERHSDEENARLDSLKRDADVRLKAIQDKLAQDLADLPDDTDAAPIYTGRRSSRYTPDSTRTRESLNREANNASRRIEAQLAQSVNNVKQSYRLHDDAIADFSHGINSQLKPGVSDIQLTPHNLGLNVKNYENFAPSSQPSIAAPPMVEMRATPGVLRMPPTGGQ